MRFVDAAGLPVGPLVPLLSFAGCVDKQPGVEYEDCHFVIGGLSQPVMDWLNDTVDGTNPRRSLIVIAVSGSLEIGRLQIGNGFLSDFRVSDFDAAVGTPGSLSFIVVPDSLQTQPPGGDAGSPAVTLFPRNLFSVAITGVDGAGIAALRGVHLSVTKVPVVGGSSARQLFVPGAHQFDDVRLEVGNTGTTAQDLDLWAVAIAQGQVDERDALVTMFKPNFTPAGTLTLFDLVPLTAPSPFPINFGRAMMLSVDRFEFGPLSQPPS